MDDADYEFYADGVIENAKIAARNGRTLADCPYINGDIFYNLWRGAFSDAKKEQDYEDVISAFEACMYEATRQPCVAESSI